MEETFLTVQQAADLLGIVPEGIRFRFIYGMLTKHSREEVPERFHQPKCRWYVAKSELDNPKSAAERLGWITSKEAAKILGCTEPNIRYYCRQGRLTPLHLPGTCRRKGWKCYFDPAEVERALAHPERKEKPSPFKVTDHQTGYMAALIDGEGCILISRRASASDRGHISHQVTVHIANTSETLMQWLIANFTGRYTSSRRAIGNQRECFTWRITGRLACQILRHVRPHMVVKARQADLAIEFQDRLNTYNAGRWKPLDADELAWRDKIKALISYENRGIELRI